MANPFLGSVPIDAPGSVTDHYGDDMLLNMSPFHVAGLLLAALILISAMKMAGFRAMVGIGRG